MVLAVGFGMTVTMWAIAYAAMLGPGLIVGEILFALTLLCLPAGGAVIGRFANSRGHAMKAAAQAGALSAALNLLIVGSLIGGETTGERAVSFAMWTGGAFGVSVLLTMLGTLFTHSPQPAALSRQSAWYSVFVRVAASAIFLLLITGGLVTGYEAGLAVPDWPNSFGHNMLLYPMTEMLADENVAAGVHYEHAHRLYGMLVGVTAIALAVTSWFPSRFLGVAQRPRVGRAGGGAGTPALPILCTLVLLLVIVQGVLGGTRVTELNIALAIIHGVFAQIIFATVVAIAAFTSATWLSDRPREGTPAAGGERTMSIVLIVMLVFQLILGALYRHLRRDAGDAAFAMEMLWAHIIFGVILAVAAVFIGGRAWSAHAEQPVLPRLGRAMLVLVLVQVLLGVVAFIAVMMRGASPEIPRLEVAVTTAHQATGALLMATAALLAVWHFRLFTPPSRGPRAAALRDAAR
jgi:heme a synthase